jgi:Fe-S-cluster-containing hydrogenase component 2
MLSPHPLRSLQTNQWFKLICGASFQDLPAIRHLALAYSLAGADCIDIAAEPAVVTAAHSGILAAQTLIPTAQTRGYPASQPWLMVSINDGTDPHFRKATFNPDRCPSDCPRPCITICPADAITFTPQHQGVIADRCYGCGRCLPICPIQHIAEASYISTPAAVLKLLQTKTIDAIEIHTQPHHTLEFQQLWAQLQPALSRLKLISISSPAGLDHRWAIAKLLQTLDPQPIIVWQTDGRPMSGDIGIGTTHAAIALGRQVAAAGLPGFIQLAGGTNHYTVAKLRELSSLQPTQTDDSFVSGIAYGSYARVLLAPILEQLSGQEKLEERPEILWAAVDRASTLVNQIKSVPTLGNS